jgi:sugar lactone lactonase YvrE
VGSDGRIFLADVGLSKLIQFDANGRQTLAWDILRANSLDGPHMARNAEKAIYVTEPESGRVLWLTPEGETVGAWSVRRGEYPPAKPIGVAVDPQGRLWVTDSDGGRVFRITPETEAR